MGLWILLLGLALTGVLLLLTVHVRRMGAEARSLTASARRFGRVAVAVDDLGRLAHVRLEPPAPPDDRSGLARGGAAPGGGRAPR